MNIINQLKQKDTPKEHYQMFFPLLPFQNGGLHWLSASSQRRH